MKFVETPLAGAFVIELERHEDERGFFARTFCREDFAARGLASNIEQCSVSYNRRAGTLRGLHYQVAPHQEAKLVRCIRGSIYDVIVDLRFQSPTFLSWHAVTLDANTGTAVYVPEDFAHGFLSVTDDATVLYQISAAYHPESSRGLRWDDPAIAIAWPSPPTEISTRDRDYPLVRRSAP